MINGLRFGILLNEVGIEDDKTDIEKYLDYPGKCNTIFGIKPGIF